MKEKIRYGITGFGRFAENTIMPAILESSNSELVAIQKRSLKEAQEKAKQYNIPLAFDSAEELVKHPDVDVVFIVSPTLTHAPEAIAAAKAGKHVLTEKPMAMNSDEAKEMIKVCKDNNVKLMVGQMARFSPVNFRIRELIKSGAIGKVAFAKAEFFYDVRVSKRWWSRDTKIGGGGPTFDIGVHCLDTLRYILDDEVVSVKSQLAPAPNEEKTELISTLALKFSKGTPANIFTSFTAPFARIFIEIIGEDGVISAERFTLSNLTVSLKIMKGKNGELNETIIEEIKVPNIYEKEVTHFSDCVINNKEPMIAGEEGLKNQIVLDEAMKIS